MKRIHEPTLAESPWSQGVVPDRPDPARAPDDTATQARRHARSTRRKILVAVVLTGLFSAAGLAHVWVRLKVVRIGYLISAQSDRERRLLEQHRKLQVERALLRAPRRLQRLARERLHLELPDPGAIRVLKMGRHKRRSSERRGRRPRRAGKLAARRGG